MGNLQINNYLPDRYSDLRKKHDLKLGMRGIYFDHEIPTDENIYFLIYKKHLHLFESDKRKSEGRILFFT